MATERDYQNLYDRIAALRDQVTSRLGPDLIANPQLADALTRQIDGLLQSVVDSDARTPPPPDQGLAELAGIGPQAASALGQTRMPSGVQPYDETITSERIIAVGDVYYLYQHERIGVFRVVRKLQELFRNGSVRLSGGAGAYALYQFDRREVLRYTERDIVISLSSKPGQLGRYFVHARLKRWKVVRPGLIRNRSRNDSGLDIRRPHRHARDQRTR